MISSLNELQMIDKLTDYQDRVKELENENLLLRNKLEFQELFNEYSNTWEIYRDNTGSPTYISPSFEKVTGYKREDFISGKYALINLAHPEDLDTVMQIFQKWNNQEAFSDCVFRIHDKSGDIKYISISSQPVYNAEKEFVGSRSSYIDITKLKLVEKELNKSRLKLKTIFDNPSEGIILVDEEGKIVDWNSFEEKHTGLAKEDVVGRFIWSVQFKLASGRERPRFTESYFKNFWQEKILTLGQGEVISCFGRMALSSGTTLAIEDLVTPVLIDNRRFYCVFQRDVTEREEIKQALKESEEKFKRIFDLSPVSMVLTRCSDTTYLDANKAFENLTGYSRDDILDHTSLQLGLLVDSELRGKMLTEMEDKKATCEYSYQIRHKSGRIIDLLSTIIHTHVGGEECFLCFHHDITERLLFQNKLKESEEKFKLLFNASPEPIFILDRQTGEILDLNARAEKVYGFTREELIGKANVIVSAEPDTPLGKIQNPAEYIPIRYHKKKNGDVFPVEISATVVDSKGKQFVITNIRDISERIQKEIELKESEERFRTLFENLPYGFSLHEVITDENNEPIDFRYLEFNSHFTGFCDLETSDIKGKTIRELNPDADPEMIRKYGKVGLTGEPFSLEYYSKTFHKYVSVHVFSPNKRQFATIFEDITERRAMENTLEEREKHLQLITDNLPVLISHISADFKYLWVNKTHTRFLGLSANKIIGKSITEVWGTEIFERCKQYYDLLFKGQMVRFENTVSDKMKQKHIFQIIFVPEITENKVVGFFTLSIDVTEQKAADFKIKVQNEELVKLNADKDQFMSVLAHDLRSPFNSILGFLELLSKNIHVYDFAKIEKLVLNIKGSAIQTYSLLEDLLQWTNAQNGKLTFQPENLSFLNVCEDVVNQLKYPAANKGILINHFAQDDISLWADRNMLSTVLRNLIFNAIKFTNCNGQINIWIEHDHKLATIVVSDNGVGIDPHNLKTLFNKSVHQTTAGTEKEKGTGFGLLICKEFVEKQGGKIWAESECGSGSDFKFTVPLFLG